MALSPDQQEIWEAQVRELEHSVVEPLPVRLCVDGVLERAADLVEAIVANRDQGKITEEEVAEAFDFFGLLIDSHRPQALICELPYEETERGLEVVLRFPQNGVDNDQA